MPGVLPYLTGTYAYGVVVVVVVREAKGLREGTRDGFPSAPHGGFASARPPP